MALAQNARPVGNKKQVPLVEPPVPKNRTVVRLFWQDDQHSTLGWGDLKLEGTRWNIEPQTIGNFTSLDQDRQSLLGMVESDGMILTAVRDREGGTNASGWLALESGVTEEPHGNHSHWHYDTAPQLAHQRLSVSEKNPARIEMMGGNFFVSHDGQASISVLSAASLRNFKASPDRKAERLIAAGGPGMALTVIDNQVAYATWGDTEGDNGGRVDVVGLTNTNANRYSFLLPQAGIVAATSTSGRVFLAPSTGLCWLEADKNVSRKASAIVVHQVSLGTDSSGKPLGTTALTSLGNHVLFQAGSGGDAYLGIVQGASSKPQVLQLKLAIAEGTTLADPVVIRARTGANLALVLNEDPLGQQSDQLLIVDLDPNRDGQFTDAMLRQSIALGSNESPSVASQSASRSKRDVVTFATGRYAAVSNPGDGSLAIISLMEFKIQGQLAIGGSPTRLLAVGN